MNVVVNIPDGIASRIAAEGSDPARRTLEALMADEFRAGRVTKAELRSVLGLEVLDEIEGFLKAHGVFESYTIEDVEWERRTLERLGF